MQIAAVHLPREPLRQHLIPDLHQRAPLQRRGVPAQVPGAAQEEERGLCQRAGVARRGGGHLPHPLLLRHRDPEKQNRHLLRHHLGRVPAQLFHLQHVHDRGHVLRPLGADFGLLRINCEGSGLQRPGQFASEEEVHLPGDYCAHGVCCVLHPFPRDENNEFEGQAGFSDPRNVCFQ